MLYHRKAFGPQRRSSRQALARDITASILVARQRGEQRPITTYTQHEETLRLVQEQLAAAARPSQLAQEGETSPMTHADHGLLCRKEDAMRIERYKKTCYWAVLDTDGSLVCLCVSRKGALEIVRRLQAMHQA